jgi:hypothetical protein
VHDVLDIAQAATFVSYMTLPIEDSFLMWEQTPSRAACARNFGTGYSANNTTAFSSSIGPNAGDNIIGTVGYQDVLIRFQPS